MVVTEVPDSTPLHPDDEAAIQDLLGYLNFSNGKPDARFQSSLNRLHAWLTPEDGRVPLREVLERRLASLHATSPAFRDCEQAAAVLKLVFDRVLPAYREHHADLLLHLTPQDFLQPFFVARVCEATLAQGGPWDDVPRIVEGVLNQLNDFLGHRPIAVLEGGQQMQPYPHERFRPVPLYLRGAGVAAGKYQELLSHALDILHATPEEMLMRAHFNPGHLDELALDVRAYDHSHPMYRRTNYTFGEWDPHCLDASGQYRRFVVRAIILDALLDWMSKSSDLAPGESLYEASAVLAGTILMASSVSGSSPETHDSNVSLTSLLPLIARQRDAFYLQLLHSLSGSHADRLRREAETAQQPFGRIRQHLNLYLAHYGCRQLQRSHLAYLFARMGYPEASREQARIIPSTAVRFESEIQWRITASTRDLRHGQLDAAAGRLLEIEDLLHRGINCGAIVDPWNILGFQGHFPLFTAREDSVADHRVEKLLELMEQIFGIASQFLCEAAAAGDRTQSAAVAERFRDLADWWDKFATTTVSDLPVVRGRESYESALQVMQALSTWFRAGESAGDIAFWKQHVGEFESARAFAMVVDVLLRKRDVVATMNLLLQWLSQSDTVPLETGAYSFYPLVVRWIELVLSGPPAIGDAASMREVPEASESPASSAERTMAGAEAGAAAAQPAAQPDWPLLLKFFDYLEANAGEYWAVPELQTGGSEGLTLSGQSRRDESTLHGSEDEFREAGERSLDDLFGDEDADDSADEDSLFSAAYDNVTFRDSAQDGQIGDTLDTGNPPHDTDLDLVARQLEQRLKFVVTLSQMWKTIAEREFVSRAAAESPPAASTRRGTERKQRAADSKTSPEQPQPVADEAADPQRRLRLETLARWYRRNEALLRDLGKLVETLGNYQIRDPLGDPESLGEYDRQLHMKFNLASSVVSAQVSCSETSRMLRSCLPDNVSTSDARSIDRAHARLQRLHARGDTVQLRRALPAFLKELLRRPLLYVPLDKGGKPRDVLAARNLQAIIRYWLAELPRAGLFRETWHLLRTAYYMERTSPPVGMSITEFDRLLHTALKSSLESLIASSRTWHVDEAHDEYLLTLISEMAEMYLRLWLKHSATMRLSSVESLKETATWRRVKGFIKKYGADLFHTRVLMLGNLRAIVHRGANAYLDLLAEYEDPLHPIKLLADLDHAIARDEAVFHIDLIFRCVAEKFDRFMEYNTTTTQSDYGEQLYCLLDFLRLEADYERHAWNLMPAFLTHEVLSRQGQVKAAAIWEQALSERTAPLAKTHLQKLRRLEKQHGIRLPSITDRLSERFVKTLSLDRILAQVRQAMVDAQGDVSGENFRRFTSEIETYLETTSGSAMDLQPWLESLADEVYQVEGELQQPDQAKAQHKPVVPVTVAEFARQMKQWEKPLSGE